MFTAISCLCLLLVCDEMELNNDIVLLQPVLENKRDWFSDLTVACETPSVLVVIRRVSIGTNGTIGTNGKALYSNGSIGAYASH